ncbi:hypothetical protein KCP71_01425 [Salmonella enterica subsp. enterica]|nr:hypothetical protein KCP71_01425 [Salmonella enterica subsp. enterica]
MLLTRLEFAVRVGSGRSLPLHGDSISPLRRCPVLCVKRSAAERDHGKRRSGLCPIARPP